MTTQIHLATAIRECAQLSGTFTLRSGVTSGTYFEDRSFLELEITLQRNDRYWRIHVIIPTILLLAISWASFFIARAAVPARVAMCALPPTAKRRAPRPLL